MKYERPRNIRGVHGSPGTYNMDYAWWIRELQQMDMGLVKLLDDGSGSVINFAREVKKAGITPIVRLWRDRPNPGRLPEQAVQIAKRYVDEGITRWFEPNNEPNLDVEWQQGAWPGDLRTNARTVMDHWLSDAKKLINVGGYPAFPALAQCSDHGECSSLRWYKHAFEYLADERHNEAEQVFRSGGWIASHDAVLNHVWQDVDKYRFNYPYDPRWSKDVLQDDNTLIGHQVPVWHLWNKFELSVPVISTEGGVFHNPGRQWDPRYPPMDSEWTHAIWTVKMFEWLERYRRVYPWYFGMCPWLIADMVWGHPASPWAGECWYQVGRTLKVVEQLKQYKQTEQPSLPKGKFGKVISYRFEGEQGPEAPPPPPPAKKRALGIDVSYWQGPSVDWGAVAGSGISFAFIRASYGLKQDDYYKRNQEEARKAGVLRGAYHYLETDKKAADQAAIFAQAIKGDDLELPPILDVEADGLTKGAVETFVRKFKEMTGKPCGIYTSLWMWDQKLKLDGDCGADLLWVAHWADAAEPTLPSAWDKWEFWQYSSTGKVPGIAGNVDLDRFNGTVEQLRKRYGEAEPLPELSPYDAFPRPREDNGLGIHLGHNPLDADADIPRMKEMGLKWGMIAFGAGEDVMLQAAEKLWAAGIMPVVRKVMTIEGGYPFDRDASLLVENGIPAYVQIFNEPSDPREWQSEEKQRKNYKQSNKWAVWWAEAARSVVEAGGFPGLQVLHPHELETVLEVLPPSDPVWKKVWFCSHNYGLNHPPAWKEDYWCVLGWQFFIEIFQERLGFVPPIICGEGGWLYNASDDANYPKVGDELHANYHKEMYEWFAKGVLSDGSPLPDYLFAVCPWILSDPIDEAWYGVTIKQQTIDAVKSIPRFVRREKEEPEPEPEPGEFKLVNILTRWLGAEGWIDMRKQVGEWSDMSNVPTRQFQQVDSVILHHMHTPSETADEVDLIQEMTKQHKDQGWGTIAYHFCIGRERVYFTAKIGNVTQHSGDEHNPSSIGVCILDDLTQQKPTAKQVDMARKLWLAIGEFFGKAWGIYRLPYFLTHSHVSTTECPGGIRKDLVWGDAWPIKIE